MPQRVISFKAPESFVELVDSVAIGLRLDRSELIRQAVLEYLGRYSPSQRKTGADKTGGEADGEAVSRRIEPGYAVVVMDENSGIVEVFEPGRNTRRIFDDPLSAAEFFEKTIRRYENSGYIKAKKIEDYECGRVIVQLKHYSIYRRPGNTKDKTSKFIEVSV